MTQHAYAGVDRRKDPRHPAAFAFWIRNPRNDHRTSAWMLDISAGGAAFLTPAEETPPVGRRLELSEMSTIDRLVRDDAGPLPRYARVVRHDSSRGVTQRVAVRFEVDVRAPLTVAEQREVTAARSEPAIPPALPPLVRLDAPATPLPLRTTPGQP